MASPSSSGGIGSDYVASLPTTNINYWKLSYQVSPIFLTGTPVAAFGGIFPMLALIAPQWFPQFANINTTAADMLGESMDDYGAFSILPGGTLLKQTVAKYPFANQWIAANATIREPLTLSLIWDTPMRVVNAWSRKLMTMQTLKTRLDFHNNLGGTYTVITPSYIYENLILTSISDASRPSSPLPQNAWRFDFEKPLVAVQDIYSALSNLFLKIDVGALTDGSWTGVNAASTSLSSQPQMAFGANAIIPSMQALGFGVGMPQVTPAFPAPNLMSPYSTP